MFENSYKIRVSARAIVFDEDRILVNNPPPTPRRAKRRGLEAKAASHD